MFESFKKIWNTYGFEIILAVCLIFICIFALSRIGKKGSWSSSYSYSPPNNSNTSRGPPKDSKGEIECRRVMKTIFNKPFNKDRPDFLQNPVTGGRFNLELDCYEASLRLAVEYNGVQHYKFVPYFHKNKEAFYNQKYRDNMKRMLCRDNRVNLIEVPNTVKINKLKDLYAND